MVCQAWAMQGFGVPPVVLLLYFVKIFAYVGLWVLVCGFSKNLGSWAEIGEWWFELEALGKGLVLILLLEVLGIAGASGPLTARYLPPFGASTYYLRPGTIKIPLFRSLGDTRNWFDVLLYAALLVSCIAACLAPELTPLRILPVLVLLPLLGLFDTQIYLAARGDVWVPALYAFLFPAQTGDALLLTWFAVWFWAAFSKLTPTFTSVVGVMVSNSPFLRFDWLKKLMYLDYPNDLRLSRTADLMAHFGTLVEFVLPILLLLGSTFGWPAELMHGCLIGITLFHAFIFFNVPVGVPMEWNVVMVYGAWVLFGMHPEYSVLEVTHPAIIALYVILLMVVPLIGNCFPRYVSFLLSMRYYAGTWPYSVWLFRRGCKLEKLDPNLVKTSPDVRHQLRLLYNDHTIEQILSRQIAFRLMHLPSRALHLLLPRAVEHIDDYYWTDGEFVAGEVIGWNFGDGHLHGEKLLASVQRRCGFAEGELRVIAVESPQWHNGRMHWRILDAATGLMEEGTATVHEFKDDPCWPIWK